MTHERSAQGPGSTPGGRWSLRALFGGVAPPGAGPAAGSGAREPVDAALRDGLSRLEAAVADSAAPLPDPAELPPALRGLAEALRVREATREARLHDACDALDLLARGGERALAGSRAADGSTRLASSVEGIEDFLAALARTQGELVRGAREGQFHLLYGVEQFGGYQRELYEGLNGLIQQLKDVVADTRGALDRLGEGDTGTRLATARPGEFGHLAQAFNQCAGHLGETLGELHAAAEDLRDASLGISGCTGRLAERMEDQSHALRETMAAMEALTQRVRDNVDAAQGANAAADEAARLAGSGGQAVGAVVERMQGIQRSARRIGDIIGVIDGIAFQTNILALNAAVEAARAGEQGRGFAVVAGEVRALAQRSASAAKEIKDLVGEAIAQVDAGAGLVGEAGGTMDRIVEAVGRVGGRMAAIREASEQQRDGIEATGTRLAGMREANQASAALVDEASAAAGQLEQRAEALAASVERIGGT
jgi:methyl-accepting chemotaxis protein